MWCSGTFIPFIHSQSQPICRFSCLSQVSYDPSLSTKLTIFFSLHDFIVSICNWLISQHLLHKLTMENFLSHSVTQIVLFVSHLSLKETIHALFVTLYHTCHKCVTNFFMKLHHRASIYIGGRVGRLVSAYK